MDISINQKAMHRFTQGHPWVFRSDLQKINTESAGVVNILSPNGKKIGMALYSPESQIALRVLSHHPIKFGKKEISSRIRHALELRQTWYPQEECYRVVFGESDALPSLIVDRYMNVIVFQTLSAGMEVFKDEIIECLREIFSPRSIVERNDARIREKEGLTLIRQVCWGEDIPNIQCKILGKKFSVRPVEGQKTGFFLDQRFNAKALAPLLGGNVLDAFCYSGQFAMHAAANVSCITSVDDSADALEQLKVNSELNAFQNINIIKENVFDYLKTLCTTQEKFDAVLLDPPAFVKSKNAISAAMRGYKEINLRAMKLLKPNGTLATSSCSHNLSRENFLLVLRQASKDAKRNFRIIQEFSQPKDHPTLLTMPESNYLKGFVLKAMD